MEKVNLFSLETHAGPYETWPRDTGLLVDGIATGKTLPGYVIEAQYKCSAGYLVITSYDCLFEESNSFLLLNESFDIISQAHLGHLYYSFLLNNHWVISEDTIRIHYHDDRFYTLSVKSFSLPFSQTKQLQLEECHDYLLDPQATASMGRLHERLQAIT